MVPIASSLCSPEAKYEMSPPRRRCDLLPRDIGLELGPTHRPEVDHQRVYTFRLDKPLHKGEFRALGVQRADDDDRLRIRNCCSWRTFRWVQLSGCGMRRPPPVSVI